MSAARFLFTNQGWAQTFLKNTIWATLAEASVRILKVLVGLLLVRALGPSDFGRFAFAFALATMFGVIADVGIHTAATREFAARPRNERLLPDVVAMKIALGLVSLLITGVAAWVASEDGVVRAMALVLGVYLFCTNLSSIALALFRARQRMEYEAGQALLQSLILSGAIIIVLRTAPSAMGAAYAYLVAGIASVVVAVIGVKSVGWRGQWLVGFRIAEWKYLVPIALPIGLAGVANVIYNTVDSVVLGYFATPDETGWYNAGIRVLGLGVLPMSLATVVTLPAFAAAARSVDPTFRRRWTLWLSAMLAIGCLCAALMVGAGVKGAIALLGPDFAPTGSVLQILAGSAFFAYAYAPYQQALILFDKQLSLLAASAVTAGVALAANVVLVRAFGLYGAAWSNVITNAVMWLELFVLCGRLTPLKSFDAEVLWAGSASVVAGLGAYAVMWLLGGELLSVPVGCAVFGVGWYLIGPRRLLTPASRPAMS